MKFRFFAIVATLVLSTTVAIAQQNYFWIGNGGDWKDASHWSLTSGGSTAGVVPTQADNVFFDANSFTLPGQIVFILDDGSNVGVVFKTMDWRSVTNTPTFQIKRITSDYVYNQCYGSLYFSDNMILDFDGAEFYLAGNADYEFDTRGHDIGQNSWLWFNSEAPVIGNVLSDINHAWIYFSQGTVNFNGRSFFGINNSNNVEQQNYPTIWLANGTATLNISNSSIDVGTINFGTGSTLVDDNATLTIRNRFQANNHNFNHVIFESVSWNGAGQNTFQTLEILPGSVVKFASAITQTINNLIADGTRLMPIVISSTTAGNSATIQKSSGTVDVFGVHLMDIAATGGATFNAHGAWNDGNVTGWNYKLDVLDREDLDALYASTNGSNWTNNALWESSPSDSRIVIDNGSPIASGGRVTSIILNNNNLTGTITGELPNLDFLTSVDLSGNVLTGTFPTVLTELNLTSLNLSNNQFTGAIPPLELTSLSGLVDLNLSNNSFNALPDLSTMPALATLNVSGNNFDFDDLEKNASIIVDDGIGFYQNQAPVSSTSYNEIPVSSDTTMTIPVGGTSNNYQWKFKGRAVQSYSNIGTNSNTYAIASINRSSMGDYMLEITNSSVPGLVLTSAVHSIAATADISGTLFHDTAMPATSGTVRLLRVTSVGSYDTIGIENVNGSGAYLFDNVVLDDYLINGWADTLLYEKSIPTWYQQTIYWEDADTLVLENNETGLDIVSTERPNHPTAGQGSISGIVYEAETDPEGKGNVAGGRVAKAATTVRRVERGGRGDEETLTLVDYLFTNDDGEFSFTKLDGGEEYRLNIQYPGYPMDENSFITIPVGTTLFDRQVGVEAEVKNGKISVRKLVITGWEEQPQHGLQAYPNPTVDYIYVKNSSGEVALEFQLLDASGRSLNVPSEWNDSDKRWELDIRAIEKGAFILQVKQKNRTDILKVIVR
jgi:hypothetical protein